ncbi:MAG: cupin domain-containing protein, partial [Okeania sp. SIO2H7]|nr:cupin domain-containing protein [Okeania sp. SIO2H7]
MTEKQTNKTNSIPHLLKASEIEAMPEKRKVHPINKEAVRNTKFLSDALGMKNLGIRLVRVEPGKETTQFHFHYHEEEFIYIISGKGIAQIGEHEVEIAAGDFM